jgi:hypothetical protein
MPKPDADHLIEIARRRSFLKLEEGVAEWTTIFRKIANNIVPAPTLTRNALALP